MRMGKGIGRETFLRQKLLLEYVGDPYYHSRKEGVCFIYGNAKGKSPVNRFDGVLFHYGARAHPG
jgi:hypothetical protein